MEPYGRGLKTAQAALTDGDIVTYAFNGSACLARHAAERGVLQFVGFANCTTIRRISNYRQRNNGGYNYSHANGILRQNGYDAAIERLLLDLVGDKQR